MPALWHVLFAGALLGVGGQTTRWEQRQAWRHHQGGEGSGAGGMHHHHVPAVQLRPTYETLAGAEVVWQVPPFPKAVLFLAHGCNHGAVDFWDRSARCPKCVGLPEEKRIVRAALSRGFAAVAVSSRDRELSRCWGTSDAEGDDLAIVARALREWMVNEDLGHVPVFALGASSGGAFVALLPFHFELAAVAVQIMAVPPNLLSRPLPGARPYPPALFIHMPRDRRTARGVAADIEALSEMGVSKDPRRPYVEGAYPQPLPWWRGLTAHFGRICFGAWEIRAGPLPVGDEYFSDRVDEIGPEVSAQIAAALRDGGMTSSEGLLLQDPRGSDWRDVVIEAVPEVGSMPLHPDESPLAEEMNVAWAGHEITADFMTQTLDWFEGEVGRLGNGSRARAGGEMGEF